MLWWIGEMVTRCGYLQGTQSPDRCARAAPRVCTRAACRGEVPARARTQASLRDALEQVGLKVLRVKRIAFGPYKLDLLAPGAVLRLPLTAELVQRAREAAAMQAATSAAGAARPSPQPRPPPSPSRSTRPFAQRSAPADCRSPPAGSAP